MSKRQKQVSLFFDTAQFASSEETDLHVWLSPDFLMQRGNHVKSPFAATRD